MMAKAMSDYEREIQEQYQRAPDYQEKDNQYKFMKQLLDTDESGKIASFTHEELGSLNQSFRGCKKIALLSKTLGLDEYEKYYTAKAEVLASSSMARKGTFLNLLFTQIRKHIAGSDKPPEVKKGIFSFGKKKQGEV